MFNSNVHPTCNQLLTIDCGKHLICDLFGQVESAAALAKPVARPVAVLKQENRRVDVLLTHGSVAEVAVVQGTAHCLGHGHHHIGDV